jgi:predicted nucleic acid-binding protein
VILVDTSAWVEFFRGRGGLAARVDELLRDIWTEAGDLGYFLARRGRSARTLDLLIATHALAHSVPLLTRDSDFEGMRGAGVPLVLVS